MKNHTLFFRKLEKMLEKLSSAADVIGVFRAKNSYKKLTFQPKMYVVGTLKYEMKW